MFCIINSVSVGPDLSRVFLWTVHLGNKTAVVLHEILLWADTTIMCRPMSSLHVKNVVFSLN